MAYEDNICNQEIKCTKIKKNRVKIFTILKFERVNRTIINSQVYNKVNSCIKKRKNDNR